MRKALTALLMVAATSAAATDIQWSSHASAVNFYFEDTHNHLGVRDAHYKRDLINRLSSDGTTQEDVIECNSWFQTDKEINFRSDYANLSGCHFILHATHAGLLEGFEFNPDLGVQRFLGDV